MTIEFYPQCDHHDAQIGEMKRRDDADGTHYFYGFYCTRCLDMQTRVRHVTHAGEYWSEPERQPQVQP
jgi:hypothetical protein